MLMELQYTCSRHIISDTYFNHEACSNIPNMYMDSENKAFSLYAAEIEVFRDFSVHIMGLLQDT